MKTFRTSRNTTQVPTAEEIVEALLVESLAATELPTDHDKLLDFLQLKQMTFDFMKELDFLPETHGQSIDLRAALSLNDRLVVTQSGLGQKRKRFGIFHEIAHFILPEHRDNIFLDTDATLGWWTKVKMEREANEIAAGIIFQGNRFTDEALGAPTSARTAIALAPKYEASYESALRRYTERHILPCALIVFQKVQKASDEAELDDFDYKIHYTITSQSFRKAFFSGLEIKGGSVKGAELLGSSTSWTGINNIVERELEIEGGSQDAWRFETEIFTNGYKIFQFMVPPLKARQPMAVDD